MKNKYVHNDKVINSIEYDGKLIHLAKETETITGETLLSVLGFTRDHVKSVLQQYENNADVKKQFVKEIRFALESGDDSFKSLFQTQSWAKLSSSTDEDKNEYCMKIYGNYIEEWFKSQLPLSESGILVLAMYQKINILILRRGMVIQMRNLI